MNSLKPALIELVNQVPCARVISFGILAQQLNIVTDATTSWWSVGRLLSSMTHDERQLCPRRRVINKQWYISSLKLGQKWLIQIDHLKAEWVVVSPDWYVNMSRYEWKFGLNDGLFGEL